MLVRRKPWLRWSSVFEISRENTIRAKLAQIGAARSAPRSLGYFDIAPLRRLARDVMR